MKIAFVNDACERLGVACLSAVLKAAGHQTKLFVDPQLFSDVHIQYKRLGRYFDSTEQIIKELAEYQPDLIGFSVDTESYQWASRMARRIKMEFKAPIIFGGSHPTAVPERVILNEGVDIVCVGEGERPMLALVESMAKGRMDMSVESLWFKNNGAVIANPLGSLIDDLDSLPLADRALFYGKSPYFQKRFALITSRGCPYACAYCVHPYLKQLYKTKGAYLRQRSVENVIEELRQGLLRHKIDSVTFWDDNFGFDLKWLENFSMRYKTVIKKRFTVTVHPEIVSRDYVRLLRQAGCCSVSLGIQAWDDGIRREWFDRDVSSDVMRGAMRLVKAEGLELICDNIYDVPLQKDEAYIRSLLPYTEDKPDRILFNKLKYFPRAPITEKARNESFLSPEWYERIMEGKDQEGICLGPDVRDRPTRKYFVQMQIFFYLMDCFPKTCSRWIINKRLYRYFPAFVNPVFIMAFRTLFALDVDSRYLKYRTLSRYGHHLIQWLKGRIKTLWTGRMFNETTL